LLAHRGTHLEDVEALTATPRFGLPDGSTERQYLNACRAAQSAREAAEEDQRQTELRNAQERQETAEAHAVALRKRSRILRRVLVGTAVIAVLAIVAAVGAVTASRQADTSRQQAETNLRTATAQKLNAQAQNMLS